jgi:acetyltransferase-like isoleucine patch superfamily enzyme
MAEIVVLGAGRIAEVAKVYLDRFSSDKVVGFSVDRDHRTQDTLNGLPVDAWEDMEQHYAPGKVKLLGPLSYQRLNEFRRERYLEGKQRGYDFTSFIHPSTHNLADVVGENSFILENCTIQPFVTIGVGLIMWSSSHIGHHATIGDNCFISSQVGIGSSVQIGSCSFIGGQAGIWNGLHIGASCYVGAGAGIRRDLAPDSVVRHVSDQPMSYSSARLRRMKFG